MNGKVTVYMNENGSGNEDIAEGRVLDNVSVGMANNKYADGVKNIVGTYYLGPFFPQDGKDATPSSKTAAAANVQNAPSQKSTVSKVGISLALAGVAILGIIYLGWRIKRKRSSSSQEVDIYLKEGIPEKQKQDETYFTNDSITDSHMLGSNIASNKGSDDGTDLMSVGSGNSRDVKGDFRNGESILGIKSNQREEKQSSQEDERNAHSNKKKERSVKWNGRLGTPSSESNNSKTGRPMHLTADGTVGSMSTLSAVMNERFAVFGDYPPSTIGGGIPPLQQSRSMTIPEQVNINRSVPSLIGNTFSEDVGFEMSISSDHIHNNGIYPRQGNGGISD